MRTARNALLALVLVAGALVGTAGLSSMHENDHCSSVWTATEGGPESRSTISAWPPGLRCELLARDGRVIDREPMTATGFLALLALELGLAALVLRAPRPLALWVRAAAAATAGLLVWGVASLWLGTVAGAVVSLMFFVAPLAGFAVDRVLGRTAGAPRRRGDGLAGLVVAPVAVVIGLFVWLAFASPLAHGATVALVAAGSALLARVKSGRCRASPELA
jgi:hypothetical protein